MMRTRFTDPCLQALSQDSWIDAFGYLFSLTVPADYPPNKRDQDMIDAVGNDRPMLRSCIESLADELFAESLPSAGRRALAWLMLTCDPQQPASFHRVLPQLQHILDSADLEFDDREFLRRRLLVWWRACEGEWSGQNPRSIFALAASEVRTELNVEAAGPLPRTLPALPPHKARHSVTTQPTTPSPLRQHVIVMQKSCASKLNSHNAPFKEILGQPLPLQIAHEIAGARAQLQREYPHAFAAVDMLLRDLREGTPLKFKPTILVGPPGSGKSRLVRRLATLLAAPFVMRYDASGVNDGQFAGTSKGWANCEASLPARAVLHSRSANPLVMIDEIDKAAGGSQNGSLHSSLLGFLDEETSARHRDISLDSELDLSWVSYICTANDGAALSAPLRDRFRILRVPAPALTHLPALAEQVKADLAQDDSGRAHDAPFAADELDIMAKAWSMQRFSMRALKTIVRASLQARDECAMRH